MTVKIRHRMHLSKKKKEIKNTMEKCFFGGKAYYSITQKCIK